MLCGFAPFKAALVRSSSGRGRSLRDLVKRRRGPARHAAEAPSGEDRAAGTDGLGHPPWEELPDAVFSAIAHRLGLAALGDLRAVCLSWRAAVSRTAESLEATALPAPPERLAAAFPGLSSLDLSACAAPLDAAGLGRTLSRLPQLSELRLGCARRLAGAGGSPAAPASAAPADPEAAAPHAAIGPPAPLPPVVPAPSDPDAPVGFTHITDESLAALAPQLRRLQALQLRTLDLGGCALVGDAGLLALTALAALVELRLRRCCGVSDVGLVAVAQMAGLTRLDVSECPRITSLGLRALAPLPLADLDASCCLLVEPFPAAAGDGPADPGCLACVSHLTTLRHLAAHGQGGRGEAAGGGLVFLEADVLRPLSALSRITSLSLGSLHPRAQIAPAAPGGRRRRADRAALGVTSLAQWLPALRALTLLAPAALAPAGDAALEALLPLDQLESLELCLSSLPSCDALAHLPALRHLRITADGRHPHSRRHAQDGGGAPPQGAAAGAGAAGPAGRSGWDWGVAPLPRGLRSLGIDVHGESERLRASGTAWLAAATSLTALWARGCWLAAPRAAEHLLALTQLEALDLTVPTDPFAGTSRPAITARDRLLAASAALPRLRRLRLAVSVDLGTSGLVGDVFIQNFSLLSALPRLEHLSLGRSGLAGHALAHPEACRVSGLTSLELRAGLHDRAGDDRLAQLLEGLPWLRKLRITGPSAQAGADAGPQFSGAGLAPLADRAARAGGDGGRGGGGSSCGCLGRGGVQNDNRGAAAVTSVVIRRCFCFGAPGARQIARLSASLLRLDLSGCSAVDDGCFGPLGDLTRLTSLDITGCVRVGDAALSTICARLRRLASLSAPGCPRFTDRGAARLPQLAASLLQLRLGPLPSLTDAGLASVGRLACLTSLQITHSRGVSDAGVPHLTGLRRLSALSLVGCRLSMDGILALAPLTGIAQIEF